METDLRRAGFVEDDPEYDGDAAADVDVEVLGFALDDPKKLPPDEGDPGQPEPKPEEVTA